MDITVNANIIDYYTDKEELDRYKRHVLVFDSGEHIVKVRLLRWQLEDLLDIIPTNFGDICDE